VSQQQTSTPPPTPFGPDDSTGNGGPEAPHGGAAGYDGAGAARYGASGGVGAAGGPGAGGYGVAGSGGPEGAADAGAYGGAGAGWSSGGAGGGIGSGGTDGERARTALNRLRAEVGKVVVGQDPAITGLVIALLCRGHVLLEGVPGVAKTLMVRALSAALALETKRLQFTPDLMPGDVTGSLIYDARTAEFSFRAGPVFTNLLLADEINRTPPKTQASLLEAMEERQVSVEGEPRPLPDPFIVIATQNPIEYEGTYPLPEAQLDRFLLKLTVPLPSRDEEFRVLNNHHRGFDPRDLRAAGVTAVADAADLAAGRAAVRGVQAAAEVLAYVVDLCRATRQSPSLSLGASPRGATALLATAKAWAWLSGRDYVTPDDVKALARPTLRHRVAVRPEAELEGVTADGVLDSVLASVPAPR
jgi:MoxR-like ATPase